MRGEIAAIAASMAILLAAAPAAAAVDSGQDGFVAVQDAHFVRQGRPYVITGANFWYGGYLGAPSGVGQRARLVKELDRLKAIGINNVRVLAVSEQTDMKSAVRPATTRKPGDYDENLLKGLDFLMAELARRDMTPVLYLNNFWQWSGGMTQYLNWFEGTPAHDPNVSRDYERFIGENARFYTDAKAQAEYRKVIDHIVNRTNTVTGKRYRDDPAVLSWQLANEPRPGNSKASAAQKATYVKWVADTARYIRSLDARHMVSSGSEGLAGSAQDAQLYMDAHRTPDIAYLTYHLWPANWGWFDPKRPDASWDGMMDKSLRYLNQHIDYAKQLHKPIVLEEFGLNRDGAAFDIRSSTTVRDRFYGAVFDLIEKRAAAGDPVGGWTIWAWGGAGRAANADYWWKPGNDFVGDPPQEEQGLYSVFDSDAGTIKVIQDSARRLQAIGATAPAAHGADAVAPSNGLSPAACAVTPMPRVKEYSWMSVAKWKEIHAAQQARAKQGGVDLMFVGDSITQGWPQDLFEQAFGRFHAANFGVGGDHTGNVLYRLDDPAMAALKPHAIVLLVGVNNYFHCADDNEQTFAGIRKVVETLRREYPDARILLNAVLPYGEAQEEAKRVQVRELNRMVATLADGRHVVYRDYGARFLQADGTIPSDLMADHLHPTPKGYQIWAGAMLPDIESLMK